MIKHSLFADQEREAKLNELGDTSRLLEAAGTSWSTNATPMTSAKRGEQTMLDHAYPAEGQ